MAKECSLARGFRGKNSLQTEEFEHRPTDIVVLRHRLHPLDPRKHLRPSGKVENGADSIPLIAFFLLESEQLLANIVKLINFAIER